VISQGYPKAASHPGLTTGRTLTLPMAEARGFSV
jgi:hypothetical protein